MQEIAYGGIDDESRQRIQDLIKEYDPINNKRIRPEDTREIKRSLFKRDRRLPIPGTIITKQYKGAKLEIKVLERGFEYNGKTYKTLSKLATEITGCHWNGYAFFNI